MTTRVFFVESTAHWEAIQRERDQFNNRQTVPIHTDNGITKISKPKSYKATDRSTLEDKRSALLVGKEGSRRRQRWNNSQLKDNPLAVLHAEDLKPPGYEYSHRPYLWNDDDLDIDTIIDTNADIIFYEDQEDGSKNNNNNKFTITKKMKHDIKRNHLPQGFVQAYENEILDYISRQSDHDHKNGDNNSVLIWEINDNYHRWIVHILCRYYNLSSNSETTSDGHRITTIEYINNHPLEIPPLTFVDYLHQ